MTLFQDFQIAVAVFSELSSFAQGAPVPINPPSVGGVKIIGSTQMLPHGPTSEFPAITGVSSLLALGFAAAGGGAVSIAEKIGNTWIGYTLQVTKE